MANPPRIWLDYRPVRIGWVVTGQSVEQLTTAAQWNSCLWGGRHNCMIPAHDGALAKRLVSCFGVDVLIPVEQSADAAELIAAHDHLEHHRWRESIFQRRGCEFADIRHALRRIVAHQDGETRTKIAIPMWRDDDPLAALFTLQLGRYPTPSNDIADYKTGVENAFGVTPIAIGVADPLPTSLFDHILPLALTQYDMSWEPSHRGWQGPGIVLGSSTDFDTLVMFWNLRAAGASLIFYDVNHAVRLKPFAEQFLSRYRTPAIGPPQQVTFWIRQDRPGDDSWKPDLNLSNMPMSLADGRGDVLWNGGNIEPRRPRFSAWHRDVVPSYSEESGNASASFSLPDRPFDDNDTQSLMQKFAVVVDASQHSGAAPDLTFETPFVPRLNEFYGRNFFSEHDAARSEEGHFDRGSVALITSVSTQRLQVSAFRVSDWMEAFFALCGLRIERSEPGLRCTRIIAQLGGLQGCRVLKVRGVRALLREYGVDQHFTRSAAITMIRDVEAATNVVGFDVFRRLHIELRKEPDLTPDAVLRYLLERKVFRAGLEFKCPNCQLPSWMHLDDVKTRLNCAYCDHNYDVTSQLKDRDWRYRRSGIFGRDDDQLGGVPVALTLQQLGSVLHDGLAMYATATKFRAGTTTIEDCEFGFCVHCFWRTPR